ncbi:MAG: hypothetical protein PHQ25_08865 [Acidobacteriota bacterium]|nr:hypothetical protein [Acidobacteriota bacterium]
MRKRPCLNLTGQFFCLLFLLVSIIAPGHAQEKLPEIIKKSPAINSANPDI